MAARDTGRLERILARRLRQVSEAKGIPLSHVADRAGVSRSYFWLLLEAKSSATLEIVQRIAEVLEVEPVLLIEELPAPARAPARDAHASAVLNPVKRVRRKVRAT